MPVNEQHVILNLKNNIDDKLITARDIPGVNRIGLLSDDTLHFEYDPVAVYGKQPDMIDNTKGYPTRGIRDKGLQYMSYPIAAAFSLPLLAYGAEVMPAASSAVIPWLAKNVALPILGGEVVNRITRKMTGGHYKDFGDWLYRSTPLDDWSKGTWLETPTKFVADGANPGYWTPYGKLAKGTGQFINDKVRSVMVNWRGNRIGSELSKIQFQEPIYRTGYHVTRYAGDEKPYLFPDQYVDELGNTIKLDNYNPVRDPNDNIPVNTFWLGGDEINYANARPEIGLHVGATEGPGRILVSRQLNAKKTVSPVVREVTWIDYPGSTRTMSDMKRWNASMDNKTLWENIGAHIDDSMLEDDLYEPFTWFYDQSTTRNIEALKKSNALLNELRQTGITSIQYGNKYEIPQGWKHIEGNLYSTPTGRKIEWPGGESHAIITPESWWSKNRRYESPVPDEDEIIPFDQYVRNND